MYGSQNTEKFSGGHIFYSGLVQVGMGVKSSATGLTTPSDEAQGSDEEELMSSGL